MPREWILANFLCCGYTAENICHNEAYRQVSDSIMLPLRKSEWLNTRNRWYTEGRIGFSSSQQTLVINTSPKKSNDSCMMGMFCIPLPLCLFSVCLDPSQSALIIPIYLLLCLYITIYHLSSLCCPPSHYLLCLFYSPWHASFAISLPLLPCFLPLY